MARKPSLYSSDQECWICHNPIAECHHIYGGVGRRPISDQEGCYVYLCREHHQGRMGVHQDMNLRDFFRADCERRWCKANNKTKEDFLELFGSNYI